MERRVLSGPRHAGVPRGLDQGAAERRGGPSGGQFCIEAGLRVATAGVLAAAVVEHHSSRVGRVVHRAGAEPAAHLRAPRPGAPGGGGAHSAAAEGWAQRHSRRRPQRFCGEEGGACGECRRAGAVAPGGAPETYRAPGAGPPAPRRVRRPRAALGRRRGRLRRRQFVDGPIPTGRARARRPGHAPLRHGRWPHEEPLAPPHSRA
mmetsp:Transcript_7510/g.20770  ORF Transcript_7510/g.20770 Transcript_7510/m.20770 type:complete len:205 (+) Transcript_7510:518-1132(+)